MTRHEVREAALFMLFSNAFNEFAAPEDYAEAETFSRVKAAADSLIESFGLEESAAALKLAENVDKNAESLDAVIARFSPTRELARIPKLLRCVLQMAVYEMDFVGEVPDKVAVNEAIDLTKEYGAGTDSSFVSGLLGGYYREKHPGE